MICNIFFAGSNFLLCYYIKEKARKVNTVTGTLGKKLISYLKTCCRVLFCFGLVVLMFFFPLKYSPANLVDPVAFLILLPSVFSLFFFFKMAVLLLQRDIPRITVTQKMKMFYVANIMILQHNEEYLCFSGNGNTRRNLQGWCKSLQITVTTAVHPFYSPCCSFHFIYSCN